MKKILIIPYSHQLGSTHTLIEMGKILRDDGYLVEFAGNGPYLKFAKDLGFIIHELIEIPIDLYRRKTDKSELDYLTTNEIEDFIEREKELYTKVKPDLIIDTLRPTNYISTKLLNIPRASLTYVVLTKHYKKPLFIPEAHFLYATKIIPPLYNLLSKFTVKIRNGFYKKFAKNYRDILQKYNLPSNVKHDDLIEGENTLLYDLPDFYPIARLPKKYSYVGPLLLNLPVEKPTWLKEVAQKKIKGKKVVYLSMGSSGELYLKILEDLIALSKTNDFILIGNSLFRDDKSIEKTKNVYLKDFLPADHILPLADLVVTHGGKGTLYHSLKHGVPILGIPHQAEQEWNLYRLRDLGLGDFVSKRFFDKEIFNNKFLKLLYSLDYRERAREFSNKFKIFDNKTAVENAIHKILKK